MTRALVFDVDGVLVHGYHARPERTRRWDENLLADLGVDPDQFREEFIFDIFITRVVTGKMSLIEALDRRLPGLGYRGSSMAFAQYWLANDSQLNTELLDAIRRLKARDDVRLFIATNQDHMRAQWLWQTMGLSEVFEDIFYSARIGMTKAHKGFFAFADADQALEAAIAMQRRLADHRRQEGFAPEVRIGIHLAEANRVGLDYHGAGVNLASRITDAAGGGEILVSASSLGAVRRSYAESGRREASLKGFSQPVEVVSVDWRS